MNLYAESSAVLAWIFGEGTGALVAAALNHASSIVASDLTLMECERVLIRAKISGIAPEAQLAQRRALLLTASAHWHILRIGGDVVDRVKRAFPVEPMRTLDAIHLASALLGRSAVTDLEMLSLDDRVRRCAADLGFQVLPSLPA